MTIIDGDEHDVAPVEMQPEHRDDERELDDGRDDRHHGEARQFLDAVATALEHARQPAGLALEMEAQRQAMHVLEGAQARRRTACRATRANRPSRICVSTTIRMRMTP